MSTTRTLCFLAFAGCASSVAPDPGLDGLSLSQVAPGTIIPGTKVVAVGASFVDDHWGAGTLHLNGQANGQSIDVHWPATFVDFSTMNVSVSSAQIDQVGGDVDFHGSASIEFVATTDGQTYASDPITLDLSFRQVLQPTPTGILGNVIFVNGQIEVDGDGFLLGGDEGTTYAEVAGCFQQDSTSTCVPVATQDIPMAPAEEFSRTKAQFPFSPKIAGIQPGTFVGNIIIVNKQSTGVNNGADPIDVTYTLVTSQVFSLDPPAASLGQYVFIHGGGFVGGEPGALTVIELKGMFNKTGQPAVSVTMQIIPEFVEGKLARYVLNTDDTLGKSLDLRKDTGHFTGMATPIISYGTDTVRGVSTSTMFDIAPVRQVVYLHYQSAYVEELRDFGLRAVDQKIRERILAVCREAYKGVNMDFRDMPPTDFALFENVDLVGVDPNNMGLFGYDNSPGKDDGNVRLYDQLGGVNATTQQDGYPGYGGVFVRSLMGFSKHPGSFASQVPGADADFDRTFDPFRPDQGGSPVTSGDLGGSQIMVLTDGSACPGGDRTSQINCAIFVMGNLIGGTLAHEIGHSLGLANPYADGFHDSGDQPNRLMDAGGDRPFAERAQLQGEGPGVFCDDEYTYLLQILPSSDPPNNVSRPSCF
jgi:hypothetical protein